MPLISVFRSRGRQGDLCEFQAGLIYIVSSKIARALSPKKKEKKKRWKEGRKKREREKKEFIVFLLKHISIL